jgi:hypothetical protein
MKTMELKNFFAIISLLGLLTTLHAEEAAHPKLLVLMKISMGKSELSPGLFAETEEGMKKVLATRGGYEIITVETALDSTEATLLFEKLKAAPGGTDETPPDLIALGDASIPRAVYELIAKASLVVIPAVVECRIDEEKKGAGVTQVKVTLNTAFDFIRREGELTRLTRLVETMGYDPSRERALADAVKTIVPLFSYETALLKELKPKIVILVLENGEAVIERGGKDGVLLGTDFVVRVAETRADGRPAVKEKGLLQISETTDDAAVGVVRYADPDLAAGDVVDEVPRLGIEIAPYAFAFIPYDLATEVSAYAGVRVVLAKGVYAFRPFLGVDFAVYPFSTYESWFPIRPFLGVEIRWYFGRLEIAMLPMIGIEEWFALSSSLASTFMGFGLRGLIQAGLLVSRDVKLFLEGGYEYWFDNRQGFLAGGGISFKL